MTADAQATFIPKPSATMVLIIRDYWIHDFNEEIFQEKTIKMISYHE